MQKILLLFAFAIYCTLYGCKSSNTSKISKSGSVKKLSTRVVLGSSSSDEIKKELGEPDKTSSVEVKGLKVENLEFNQLGTIQVQDNIAQAFMRLPEDNERVVQYWLQKWAKEATKTSTVLTNIPSHTDNDEELSCPKENTSVIYDKSTGIVKRVIVYAKK